MEDHVQRGAGLRGKLDAYLSSGMNSKPPLLTRWVGRGGGGGAGGPGGAGSEYKMLLILGEVQNIGPMEYPYAYLITASRFLGCAFKSSLVLVSIHWGEDSGCRHLRQ